MVCDIEEGSSVVLWVAHGSSLVQRAPEQLRAELPKERACRIPHAPDTEATEAVLARVCRALRPVRGPLRFLDLL